MNETDERANVRLRRMTEEAHLDALRHPDPCGTRLFMLQRALRMHMLEERRSIEAYERLAHTASDPAVRSVMQLLVEDERRHHRLFAQICTNLDGALNWTSPIATGGPVEPTDASQLEWLQQIRDFEAEEQRGADELRNLAHTAREQADSLASILLETMAMDSEKHAHLLRFVGQRLKTVSSPGR